MRLLPVDTAVTVFVNATALIDDTDFKTREESVTYNQAGLDLVWNFETSAGVITQTAVTPTDTAGVYDWTNVGNGMYKIEIPASGGGTINNDTEGYGFFTGFATGILPWTGPTYCFAPAHVVNGLVTGSDNLQVDTVQLSSDGPAADNAEAFFDGTGYAGTNNVIPTVTTLTGHTAQTGDSYARLGAPAGASIAADLVTIDNLVDDLEKGIILGAAATGTLSTTQATSDLTGYANDQLIGRVIIWLTGDCTGEATDITDYASASGLLTFTALTTAPGNGDTFKIV